MFATCKLCTPSPYKGFPNMWDTRFGLYVKKDARILVVYTSLYGSFSKDARLLVVSTPAPDLGVGQKTITATRAAARCQKSSCSCPPTYEAMQLVHTTRSQQSPLAESNPESFHRRQAATPL